MTQWIYSWKVVCDSWQTPLTVRPWHQRCVVNTGIWPSWLILYWNTATLAEKVALALSLSKLSPEIFLVIPVQCRTPWSSQDLQGVRSRGTLGPSSTGKASSVLLSGCWTGHLRVTPHWCEVFSLKMKKISKVVFYNWKKNTKAVLKMWIVFCNLRKIYTLCGYNVYFLASLTSPLLPLPLSVSPSPRISVRIILLPRVLCSSSVGVSVRIL